MKRKKKQKLLDFFTFPFRALMLSEHDKWGLSSLRSERFDYVADEVKGYCLDVGCGRHNLFVREYLKGNGIGVDVFQYEGLEEDHVLEDISQFPFDDDTFDSVTFIACINHVPNTLRNTELREAYRCLKSHGNIIITMGNPFAEIMAHKVVSLYDSLFGTQHDVDAVRGMAEGEDYYVRDSEIIYRLLRAGFMDVRKKYFLTQWGLNHLFVAWKRPMALTRRGTL